MSNGSRTTMIECTICKRAVHVDAALRVAAIPPALARIPRSSGDEHVCGDCLALERLHRLKERLASEHGELSALEDAVARSTASGGTIARRVSDDFAKTTTRGQHIADAVARIGGSWAFVIGALVTIGVWIGVNAVAAANSFDPFPFILLNLVLSCVAALQAPIILMSQNRSAARDRAQADQDFLVNLKAELEVSGLHSKIDYLLHTRWEDLLAVQQLQLDLLTELRAQIATRTGDEGRRTP